MLAEHLKEWLEEARKAEKATAKAAEEAEEATIGPWEEGAEAERETGTKKGMKNGRRWWLW